MSAAASPLSALVQDFFCRYLPLERNLSANSVLSYRDALKLFMRFLCTPKKRSPERLTSEDVLDAQHVRGFLRWLAQERRCKASTRNQRLAALKSFARYVASRAPEHLDRCRQIREIPRASVEQREVEYLDTDETARIVQAPAPNEVAGLRDRALLLLLYNTGARVQEVCDLDVKHIRLDEAPCVRLMGKGRKERVCPLWTKTVSALRVWLKHRNAAANDAPLFLNAQGRRLSRSGVAYVLTRATTKAGLKKLKHARRVTPHVIRHTTAMHLLQVGADLTVIASWLGHAQISTTHGYVTISLRMKQEAVAAATLIPELRKGVFPAPDIVAWLERLGQRARYVESSPPRCPPDRASASALHITECST
jgi:site-specific recombinase XerD